MRPEIIKKIREKIDEIRKWPKHIPAELPLPKPEEVEDEEVSVISRVIIIDL